jgi:hypothetical protein
MNTDQWFAVKGGAVCAGGLAGRSVHVEHVQYQVHFYLIIHSLLNVGRNCRLQGRSVNIGTL